MPIRQKIFALAISIGLIIFIVDLVRRRKLREEYSWLWLLTGFIIFLVALWYDLLIFVTNLIGAAIPTSALFFLSLIFLIAISINYSIQISTLTNQVKELAQSLALLRGEIEEREEKH